MPSDKALETAMSKPNGGTFETLADHIDERVAPLVEAAGNIKPCFRVHAESYDCPRCTLREVLAGWQREEVEDG